MKMSEKVLIAFGVILVCGLGMFFFSSPSVHSLLGEFKDLVLRYPLESGILAFILLFVYVGIVILVKEFYYDPKQKK